MFISPMLLETAAAPFSDSRYIYEPKIDGHRLIYSQESANVKLYTRHNNECTRQYPESNVPFPHDIKLDGEIACVDPLTGAVDFESVMSRFQARRFRYYTPALTTKLPVTYVIFDILRYKGEDLRNRQLMERKAILGGLSLPNAHFGVTPYIEGAGEALFTQMQARAMEGVVAKRKDSVYETGKRSAQWQKIINWTYADVYLSGYKKAEFGWLASVPDNREKYGRRA